MSDTYSTQGAPSTDPLEQEDLAQQWRSWIDNPANRAFLIQTGAALSQPVGLGQNALGHVGQAIGSGGEAMERVRDQDRKDAETAIRGIEAESRATAREASAAAAATRADAATVRAQAASSELGSRIAQREAQAQASLARATFLQARVKELELRTSIFPEDQQAKIELNNARAALARSSAGLATERAGVVEQDADTRRMNAETRRDLGQQRVNIQGDRTSATREGQGLTAMTRLQSSYQREVANIRKTNTDNQLLNPTAKPIPIPSFAEWREKLGSGGDPLEGRTATGPRGEKLIRRSGQWVPQQ